MSKEEIQLAREILEIKETSPYDSFILPFVTKSKKMVCYEDDYIEIVAAIDTKAISIQINNPLTSASSNPVIYVDDEGKCYRSHGERISFRIYAELLLGKEVTMIDSPMYKQTVSEIKALF